MSVILHFCQEKEFLNTKKQYEKRWLHFYVKMKGRYGSLTTTTCPLSVSFMFICPAVSLFFPPQHKLQLEEWRSKKHRRKKKVRIKLEAGKQKTAAREESKKKKKKEEMHIDHHWVNRPSFYFSWPLLLMLPLFRVFKKIFAW